MKMPFSWKAENYVFGACALRDEIQRRKEEKEYHGFWNEAAVRLLMVYGSAVGLILCLIGICVAEVGTLFAHRKENK